MREGLGELQGTREGASAEGHHVQVKAVMEGDKAWPRRQNGTRRCASLCAGLYERGGSIGFSF